MALIEWTDELSVGVEEIDDQHKVLVDLINSLDEAIHSQAGKTASVDILNQLVEYTRIHFDAEEALMRTANYPDFDKHKAQHEVLLQQAESLQQKIAGGAGISFQLLHFLKTWLTQHILDTDKQYTPHLVRHASQSQFPAEQKRGAKKGWLSRIFPWWQET